MALKVIKANEKVIVSSIIMVIYGQAGIGKTSLTNTADKVLTLDFEKGAHRSAYRKDIVQVNTWEEVADISTDDLADYQTIVIDTMGAMVDSASNYLLRINPKNKNNATGGLSINAFGALKILITNWLKNLKSMNKDIILVGHGKEEKKGDNILIRPDVAGSSYSEIMKVADFVGYYHMNNINGTQCRVLDFNPTEAWVGKNSAQFPALIIPHLTEQPNYFAGKIEEAKAKLNDDSEAQKLAIETIREWTDKIYDCESPAQLTVLVNELNSSSIDKVIIAQIKNIIKLFVENNHWQFNSETKQFETIEKEMVAENE